MSIDDYDERKRASARRYQENLHARGLCIRCRKPLEAHRAHYLECAACSEITRARSLERQKRLAERGLCVQCGVRQAMTGRKRCLICAAQAADADYKRRHGQG